MALDANKELTPVLYGESAVKILKPIAFSKNALCFRMHWHERIELLYVVSGSISIRLNNSEVTARAGSLAVIPPEKIHMGTALEEGTAYYTIMFDVSSFYNSAFASRVLLEPITEKTVDFLPVTSDPEIIFAVKRLINEEQNGDNSSSLIIISGIYLILGLLYRKCLLERPSLLSDERFRDILKYISKNCCNEISSFSLSRRFGYSEEYFCRRFKCVTGLTPMSYINILRLEKAKKLIDKGEKQVSAVFAKTGFSDMSYFTKRFKKHFGITPSMYIKKAGEVNRRLYNAE